MLPLSPPLAPQLARSATALPQGDQWVYEPKFDGFRAIVFVDEADVIIQSRGAKSLNRYFPELRFPKGRYVIDGEIVIRGNDGHESFEALQSRRIAGAALGEVLAASLTRAGADPWVPGAVDELVAWRAAGEAWGRPPHVTDEAPSKPWALLYDATGFGRPEDLRGLYDFFHPRIRDIGRSGRGLVLARPPESCSDAASAAAMQAVEPVDLQVAIARAKAGQSQLDEIFAIADRIAVIHHGRLTAAKPVADWTLASIGLAMAGTSAAEPQHAH